MVSFNASSPSLSGGKSFLHQQQNDHIQEWNVAQVQSDLQAATHILRERGFLLAATWAAEQWMGLEEEEEVGEEQKLPPPRYTLEPLKDDHHNPRVAYAQCLLSSGQNGAAAAALSTSSSMNMIWTEDTVPPPLPQLSPAALQIRAYALYLEGEGRRAREWQEHEERQQHTYV